MKNAQENSHKNIGEMIRDMKIERGAKALRQHQMSGRFTKEWDELPKGKKRKWIEAVTIIFDAAENID